MCAFLATRALKVMMKRYSNHSTKEKKFGSYKLTFDKLMILYLLLQALEKTVELVGKENKESNFGNIWDEICTLLGNFLYVFRSLQKGVYGIGNVCLEPLRDVWADSKLRKIN